MELKWLKDFLTLHAEGNFRLAAEQRNVSQPAFSRRIQALEAWIGVLLIDRSCKPTQMTEAGKLFLPVAQNIVNLAKRGKDTAQAQVLKENGEMRFATLSTLSQIFIPAWLNGLGSSINVTQLIIKTHYVSIADYFMALDENHVDFFVCYLNPEIGFLRDTSLFLSRKLGEESFVPVVSPDKDGNPRWWLPDRPQNPIPCLHTHSDQSPWPIKHHMAENYGDLAFDTVYNSSSGTALKEMAIQGFGLAWLPLTLIADSLKNGQLVRADAPAKDILVDIKIYRSRKFNEPTVDEFWQVLGSQTE